LRVATVIGFFEQQCRAYDSAVFKGHYDRWVARLSRGETIELPTRAELPEPETVAMSKEEQQQALNQLRAALDL